MNDRQRAALTDPLNTAGDPTAIARHRHIHQRGDGSLLVTILAVDR